MPTPLSNGHEQFAIEMFCQWSSVSTISRTTLWLRYDKERLSIHCRKVSGKTKHFARYVPSVWLEGHSFLMSYWLSMSVLTIPTLIYFDFKAVGVHYFILLSAKTLKRTIYHPGALINRTSGFSFPKVSPPNQTGSVLEAFPLRFEPSLPNPFRALQEKYSSLHNT